MIFNELKFDWKTLKSQILKLMVICWWIKHIKLNRTIKLYLEKIKITNIIIYTS